MSSCDCTITAQFKVSSDVNLQSVIPIFKDFIKSSYNLFPSIDLAKVGAKDFSIVEGSDFVRIEEGYLSFRLYSYCAGQDFLPKGVEELLEKLDPLAIHGGAVEIYNQDTPADADSTCMVRFVGAAPHLKTIAQVHYGLEQAATWIAPVIGDDGFSLIRDQVMAIVNRMPGTLSAQKAVVALAERPGYAEGSMAGAVFGNTRTPVIELCNFFEARDAKGSAWAVTGVYIHCAGSIPDVYVNLGRPGAYNARLADDDVFIDAVMAQLRKAGYTGDSFGRCELGMQGDSCVVLEPGEDFVRFAQSRGFALAPSFYDDEDNEGPASDPSSKKAGPKRA